MNTINTVKKVAFSLSAVALLVFPMFSQGVRANENQSLISTKAVVPGSAQTKVTKSQQFVDSLNEIRNSCGFNSLSVDKNLQEASEKHSAYLRYITENMPHQFRTGPKMGPFFRQPISSVGWTPHSQKYHRELKSVTGRKNPYYSGKTVRHRIKRSGYPYAFDGKEVIGFPDAFLESDRNKEFDEKKFNSMLSGLLSAPYHALSLLNPSYHDVGVTYSLHKAYLDEHTKNLSNKHYAHSLVFEGGFGPNIQYNTKTLTYPCNGTKVTSLDLKNEVPDPLINLRPKVRYTGSLDYNSISAGHPVYVISNTPNKNIDISNVVFKKIEANGSTNKIKVYVLSHKNDPHRLLPKHQGVIIPLLQLEPESEYLVDFDYSERDGRKHKSIHFKT